MNKQVNFGQVFILVLVVVFAPLNALAHNNQPSKPADKMVFEIVSEGWAHGRVSATFIRLYKSGRVTYEEASKKSGQEKFRTERTTRSRVNAKKIAKLIMLAEQPDFLNAKDRYNAFSAAVDAGGSRQVTYFHKSGKKTIKLAPYYRRRNQSEEQLPPSLKEFLEKVSQLKS